MCLPRCERKADRVDAVKIADDLLENFVRERDGLRNELRRATGRFGGVDDRFSSLLLGERVRRWRRSIAIEDEAEGYDFLGLKRHLV